MSQLEQITLLVITGMAHAVLALALLFFRKPDEIRSEVRLWLLAQTLAGMAYTLFLWRKVGSLFWFSSLPNAMIALSYGLMVIALALFFGVRRLRYLVGVTVITTLAQLLLRELGLSEPFRLASVVLIASLPQAVLCVLYVRQWRSGSALIRVLAAANGLIVFMFLLRATEALRASADYSFFHAGWGQTIGLLGLYASALTNNFGFLLLVQERTDQELVRLSMLDPLTETLNRRSFIDGARRQLAMADRSLHPVSMLMCDIDHFKQINDRYGHHAGDDVIKAFVAVARNTVRTSDSLGRWGGEEFVILLPNTPLHGAIQLGLRMNQQFAVTPIAAETTTIRATVSIGVAEHLPTEDIQATIDRADAALYRAKSEGRNRVEPAPTPPASSP